MSRLRWLFRRRHTKDELAREIDAHIAERVDDLIEGGVSPENARTIAMREFGNSTLQIEKSREVWIAPWLTSIWQDLRYAVRSLARQPGFTVTAVGILAVGIGLVTTLFTVINGVFLRPWNARHASSLAIVVQRSATGGVPSGLLTSPEYRYLREHSRSFTHLASWTRGESLIPGEEPVEYGSTATHARSTFVSANYFDTLGIGVQVGRTFREEEENYGTPHAVAIISDRLWRDYFGASEAMLGDAIRVRELPFTVIGVAARDFRGPDIGVPIDLWMPLPSVALLHSATPGNDWLQQLADPTSKQSSVIGRLRPGITRAGAAAELTVLSQQFRTSLSLEPYGISLYDTRLISALSANAGHYRGPLAAVGLIFGALLLVMLLACANTGNLVLARGLSRQREIATRLSLGASRARVVRQLLTESLVIAVAAGAVAVWVASLVPWVFSQGFDKPERFSPDAAVFGFASIMAMIACVISGVTPALWTTKMNLATRANERAGRAGAGRLRTVLLATQLALSMVLLIGAGLLTRTINHVATLDPGFAIHEVQAIGIRLPGGTSAEERAAFARTLRAAVDADDLPAIAFSEFTAITTGHRRSMLRRDGEDPEMDRFIVARPVSANYFSVLGIPFVEGRSLADDERAREVVINQAAARLFWPNGTAVGRRLVGGEEDYPDFHEVVGVVQDVAVTSLTDMQPVVYQPIQSGEMLFVRDLSPTVVDRVTSIASAIEPRVRVASRPLSDDLTAIASSPEFMFARRVAWTIALLALALATVGAFGVFAYMVEERRREIGVRMALGAQARQVVWAVIGGARLPLAFGLGIGLVLSLGAAQMLRSFLFGLSPFDPITYLGIAAILVAAALLATWLPARRATRIDPAITLRGD